MEAFLHTYSTTFGVALAILVVQVVQFLIRNPDLNSNDQGQNTLSASELYVKQFKRVNSAAKSK